LLCHFPNFGAKIGADIVFKEFFCISQVKNATIVIAFNQIGLNLHKILV